MDYNLWQQLILGATKPFRTGANILAQNWGSALTGKDMSQRGNQGRFLRWLSEGITPEEQQVITEKPYLSALKSSAGMASTLAPFASQGLRTAQLAANPLANRIAQLASQGALEGSLGGFGYSREGREVQDTLTGGLVGAGGELFMDYLTNPQFRKLVTDATTTVNPQTGVRMYKGALEDKQIEGEILDTLNPTGTLLKSEDPYLYHGTGEAAFRKIRQEGLKPSSDGKYIYLSDTEDYARTYSQRKGSPFGERILRIKRSDAITPDPDTGLMGDYKTLEPINPLDIEVRVGKKWVNIQDYFDEEINIGPIRGSIKELKGGFKEILKKSGLK